MRSKADSLRRTPQVGWIERLRVAHHAYEEQYYRRVGSILQICQLNVEGISKEKAEYLGGLLDKQMIDVLVLQETHGLNDADLLKRINIPGFSIAAAIHHRSYGIATYIREKQHPKCLTARMFRARREFNNHRHACGYVINDEKGTALHKWSTDNDLNLIFDPKDKKRKKITHQTCAFYQD
ncbi:hypothetical protein J437_LFUL007198 [Ladona fulva]|uniref:Endonuclease n=1 Tax=Ladona fulva TaxID=123851 RepID=A0A8K0NZX0_LADFU|nr:hypothetical protein J437_LFUL007198 [Ladona fulva]